MGVEIATRCRASKTPFATSSTRVMPPKILTKIAFTSIGVDDLERRGHHVGVGAAAMSKKFAAEPPTWLTTSSVDIARPAPLAMMPTVPSRPM